MIMDKLAFDLQLFADDVVDVDTLKEHGFTDDELKDFLSKEPETTPKTEPAPGATPETIPAATEEPATVGVTDEEPHADNLRAALKEERERRKVLAAKLAALEAKQPTQVTQPAQPQQSAPQQQPKTDIRGQIKTYAKQEAAKILNIEGNPQDLMFTDTEKYEDYLAERAKIELQETTKYEEHQRVYADNVSFVNELQSQQDFPVLYQFAVAELDELPGKQARVIEQAFNKINQGMGSKEDIATVRKFASDCREKMNSTNPEPPVTMQGGILVPNQQQTAQQQPSKLDQAAGLPRATHLGGAKSASMSWVEVEKLATQGKFDQIPKELLAQIDPKLLE
jgi:DNA-binding transcriptional MerR regulator